MLATVSIRHNEPCVMQVIIIVIICSEYSIMSCTTCFHNSQLQKSTAVTPSPNNGADTTHLPAPACIFSKGLPLPFAGRPVACEPPADVEVGPCVSAGPEAPVVVLSDAAVDADGLVELASPSTVDVMGFPVLMPVGPITTGTMT